MPKKEVVHLDRNTTFRYLCQLTIDNDYLWVILLFVPLRCSGHCYE